MRKELEELALIDAYINNELNPAKVSVPQEFQGLYNVRFIGQIMIDAEIRNVEPIKFFGVPLNITS